MLKTKKKHSLPWLEFNPKWPVREEERVIDGIHGLAHRVGQLELAQDCAQQDVHVLFGESSTRAHPKDLKS